MLRLTVAIAFMVALGAGCGGSAATTHAGNSENVQVLGVDTGVKAPPPPDAAPEKTATPPTPTANAGDSALGDMGDFPVQTGGNSASAKRP